MVRETLTKAKLPKPQLGQKLVVGLKGIYTVEDIQEVDFGGQKTNCLTLSLDFSKTQHKTFLPIDNMHTGGNRELVSVAIIDDLPNTIPLLKLDPIDFNLNSNKKMLTYEKRIADGGFLELIKSYLCIKSDVETSGRADKRYISHLDRLCDLVAQEISLVKKWEVKESRDWFLGLIKSQTSH